MDTKKIFVGSVYLIGNKFPCKMAQTRVCAIARTQWEASKKIETYISNHPYFSLGEIESIEIESIDIPKEKCFGVENFQFIP